VPIAPIRLLAWVMRSFACLTCSSCNAFPALGKKGARSKTKASVATLSARYASVSTKGKNRRVKSALALSRSVSPLHSMSICSQKFLSFSPHNSRSICALKLGNRMASVPSLMATCSAILRVYSLPTLLFRITASGSLGLTAVIDGTVEAIAIATLSICSGSLDRRSCH
jgi:hypothetical protein